MVNTRLTSSLSTPAGQQVGDKLRLITAVNEYESTAYYFNYLAVLTLPGMISLTAAAGHN